MRRRMRMRLHWQLRYCDCHLIKLANNRNTRFIQYENLQLRLIHFLDIFFLSVRLHKAKKSIWQWLMKVNLIQRRYSGQFVSFFDVKRNCLSLRIFVSIWLLRFTNYSLLLHYLHAPQNVCNHFVDFFTFFFHFQCFRYVFVSLFFSCVCSGYFTLNERTNEKKKEKKTENTKSKY